MSYWVVPILSSTATAQLQQADPVQCLDMMQIRNVVTQPSWQWTSKTPKQHLIGKYLVDPMNGGRRYYSNWLAHHLKPQDPVPAYIPKQSHKFMKNILDYTDSKWLKSRDISRWDPNQPVLEVEKIPFRRNHLARVEDREKKELDSLKTYVCPEPLRISNVSNSCSR
jgi:endoribonuclease Dicer